MACSGCKKKNKTPQPSVLVKSQPKGINTKEIKEVYPYINKHDAISEDELVKLNKVFNDLYSEDWVDTITNRRKFTNLVENILK